MFNILYKMTNKIYLSTRNFTILKNKDILHF